jgi:predicted flap endonuclease-1-like 5' DNA nuclease
MRLDYISYTIAIVFFIVTLAAAVYSFEQTQVWVVTTVVIGLAFIGLGYTQRPRPAAAPQMTTIAPPPPPSQPQQQQTVQEQQEPQQQQIPEVTTAPSQPVVTDMMKLEENQPVVQSVEPVQLVQPMADGLTDVKGIGEKRAAQLRALGISSVEDLAKASAKDLAARLNVSPKITDKWIQNAKGIGQNP